MHTLKDPRLVRQLAYVNGKWVAGNEGRDEAVIDPASEETIGRCTQLDQDQVAAAIDAADAAFPAWRARSVDERGAILGKWHDLLLENKEDLARLMTLEQGKPLDEARGEIDYAASFIRWFAEEARRAYGETIPSHIRNAQLGSVREPIGVAALITPWNFPCAMITRKAAAALAVGCTVLVKPAGETPFSALALAELAERAGFPAGVFNVITGEPEMVSQVLCASDKVKALSFTGSTRVGALLAEQCAPTLKKMSLELGGNAPFIVFDDANLDAAVEGAMLSKFRNGGQTCVCANRILVQSGIHDAFVAALAARVDALRVGPGTEDGTAIGPMINSAAIDKIRAHVADALDKGASIATQPRDLPEHYADPVVLTGATTDMVLASEETFGPVAPIFRFETEEEVIAIANGTPFGLAAYFYTRDMARAFRVGEALEFGMVGLNTGLISQDVSPFGGVKSSGLGREGAQEGIEEYLETKAFHFGFM